jgi:hypothetical protein
MTPLAPPVGVTGVSSFERRRNQSSPAIAMAGLVAFENVIK